MDMYELMIKNKTPAPLGLFSKWIAKRISNDKDRQDLLMGIFSGRGEGKSRSALYICWAVAQQLSLITGKPAEHYFTGENVISLAEGAEIAKRLAEIPDCSCVICDDAGVGINSRDFQTRSSKGVLKIISTCRTKRLFLVFTAPAKTHIDVALRGMLAVDCRIHKPCHSMGYNLLKINRTKLSASGREYSAQIGGNAGKITYWICPNAPAPIVKEYDKARDESANLLATDVSAKVSQVPKVGRGAEYNREQDYLKYGDAVRKLLLCNSEMSSSKISAKLGVHEKRIAYLKERILGETNV
jgi:hypothetical protein